MPQSKLINLQPGVGNTIFFSLEDPVATGSDKFVTGTVAGLPIVAGDVKISIDGGAVANTVNLPTQVTVGQPFYALVLTAAELTGFWIRVIFQDQTTPAAWRSFSLDIFTVISAGRLYIDATGVAAANQDAVNFIAKGTGLSLNLTPGSARHTNIFDTVMGAEPTAITAAVGATRSIGAFIQDLWYRFYRTHKKMGSGASGQVLVYKEDDVTPVSTQTASKTGTDQTISKAS